MDYSIKLITSGSEFINRNWGGFYSGGNYLLYGKRKSGKTLLALNFIKSSLEEGKKCIYFTDSLPRKIIIQASSINLDLEKYLKEESVLLFRTPEPDEDEEFISQYYKNISSTVKKFNAERIVIDEVTPYLDFINLRHFDSTFKELIEDLSDKNAVSLFVSKEPADVETELLLEQMNDILTGTVHLKKSESDKYSGEIKIVPNYGHTEGEFSGKYKIVPGKGFVNFSEDIVMNEGKFYKNISSISEYFEYSNLYSYEDFLLILNNQIAFCKVTNHNCALVAVKCSNPNKNFKELLDVIWRTTEKKNKISSKNDKILVLLKDGLEEFTKKLKNTVKEKFDQVTINSVYISEFHVDENTPAIDKIMDVVFSEENFRHLFSQLGEVKEEKNFFMRYNIDKKKDFTPGKIKNKWR